MAMAMAGSLTAALVVSGCGKSDDVATTSSDVALTGTLSTTTSSGKVAFGRTAAKGKAVLVGDHAVATDASVDFTGMKVVCTTFSTPPEKYEGKINSDGSFSVDIAGGKGQPMNCDIKASDDSSAGSIITQDSSTKDMNGNAQTNGTLAFKGSATLGTMSYDSDSGQAIADASKILGSDGANALAKDAPSVADAFDPTGSWTIKALDFTAPTGFHGPCSDAERNAHTCEGPGLNESLYVKRINGVSTADSSTPVFGLMLWRSEADFTTTCGGKIGMTAAQARAIGVDLSAYGSALAPFAFSTTVNYTDSNNQAQTATVTNGWKFSTAKSNWNISDCAPKDVTVNGKTMHGWSCVDSNGYSQVNIGGGCKVDSTGKPVEISDWSSITWGGCDAMTAIGSGYYRSSCHATYGGKAVTCNNDYGMFLPNGTAQNLITINWGSDPHFDWANVATLATSGQLCSAINVSTTKGQLAQLQCYANEYWNIKSRVSNACLPRVETNWAATNPNDFADVDFRPDQMIFFDKLTYTSTKTASLRSVQNGYRGVEVKGSSGGSSWVPCRTQETGVLTVKAISDTKMLCTYVSTTTTSSVDQPVCVAKFGTATSGSSSTKYMFYMTK